MGLCNKTPIYPHYAHLPFAYEPLKTIYVVQRVLTTVALVPYWALKYAVLPRKFRPRSSWSIIQIVNVNFTRRIYRITEVAGVTWGTRDPQAAPEERCLKHTRFQWINPLPAYLRNGVVDDGVPFLPVGAYIYPKEPPVDLRHMSGNGPADFVIGLFMHGGGYCHMSAHESSRTSRIPKRLIKDGICDEVYSVEYRLLQHARFPAAIQDVAAVYAHVTQKYQKFSCKIILVGDSSGGNLVLALSRWIRDMEVLPMPHALLLLSPSCDPSHALPKTPSSYIPRSNGHTDYLTDTPEPRALLLLTLLGFQNHLRPLTTEECQNLTDIVHSEYVSPCSPVVLKRWGHAIGQDDEGTYQEQWSKKDDAITGVVSAPPGNTSGAVWHPQNSPSLFYGFPKTLVVAGDAERLTREINSLIQAMEKDGVETEAFWIPDAVHDVLIMREWAWDKQAANECWVSIKRWSNTIRIR